MGMMLAGLGGGGSPRIYAAERAYPSHMTAHNKSHRVKLCHPDWSEAEWRDLLFHFRAPRRWGFSIKANRRSLPWVRYGPTARRGRRDDKLEAAAHLGMGRGGWTDPWQQQRIAPSKRTALPETSPG
jgi:hypothetical protein